MHIVAELTVHNLSMGFYFLWNGK